MGQLGILETRQKKEKTAQWLLAMEIGLGWKKEDTKRLVRGNRSLLWPHGKFRVNQHSNEELQGERTLPAYTLGYTTTD